MLLAFGFGAVEQAFYLADAMEQASTLGRLRGIALQGDVTAQATVLGDPQRLQQIFGILLDNAVHYSHAGGMVEVSATTEVLQGKQVWALRVRDDGIGVAEDELPRLFERFHRVEGAQGQIGRAHV